MNPPETSTPFPARWLGSDRDGDEQYKGSEATQQILRPTQGRSRADGYYLHEPPESVGLYWVVAGLDYLKPSRRFPHFLMSLKLSDLQAALVATLADNIRAAILARKRRIEAAVRQHETREFINNIISSKGLAAGCALADYIKAESTYNSSVIDYPGDTRLEHEQWLSIDDEYEFSSMIKKSELEILRPHTTVYHQRINIRRLYPDQAKKAARIAREFVIPYLKSDKFWFRDYPCVWQLRPRRVSMDDPNKILRGDHLRDMDPEWMTMLMEAMQAAYSSDEFAWRKILFRVNEPTIRISEFERAKLKNERPRVGKAYLAWEENHGRYWGAEGTAHGVLLKAVRDLDRKTDELLTEMNIGGYQWLPKKRKGPVHERLHAFLERAGENHVSLQILTP